MKTEYLEELHPEYYGLKKENYNEKIYLDGVINKEHSTVKEILSFLNKTYCGPIGYEYMHISNPTERKWLRDRIEQDENSLQFTKNGKEAILNKLIQAAVTNQNAEFQKMLAAQQKALETAKAEQIASQRKSAFDVIREKFTAMGIKEVGDDIAAIFAGIATTIATTDTDTKFLVLMSTLFWLGLFFTFLKSTDQ